MPAKTTTAPYLVLALCLLALSTIAATPPRDHDITLDDYFTLSYPRELAT